MRLLRLMPSARAAQPLWRHAAAPGDHGGRRLFAGSKLSPCADGQGKARSLSAQAPAQPHIKFVYFPLRGRLESVRMMLHGAGMRYEEELIPLVGDSWKTAKKSGRFPFGQLPVMYVDKRVLAQSGPINRYIASLTGYMPKDPWRAARADMFFEATQEMELAMPLVNRLKGDKFEEHKKKYLDKLPRKLDAFSSVLVGTSPYLLRFFMERIEGLSGVKEYLAGRPQCVSVGSDPQWVPKESS